MSNGVFYFNFLLLLLSEILWGPKFILGGPTPPGRPIADNFFLPKASISSSSTFRDIRGSQIYIRGPCAPRRPPSRKILTCAQVLAYIYIIVNSQLRISITAGLTECSLYNRFALKNLPKSGFWGILGGGANMFGGNPLEMQ